MDFLEDIGLTQRERDSVVQAQSAHIVGILWDKWTEPWEGGKNGWLFAKATLLLPRKFSF